MKISTSKSLNESIMPLDFNCNSPILATQVGQEGPRGGV